jgi:Mannosyltransferase (PIG-V)
MRAVMDEESAAETADTDAGEPRPPAGESTSRADAGRTRGRRSARHDSAAPRARLKSGFASLVRSPAVRSASVAFLVTRLLVFSLFILTARFDAYHPDPRSTHYDARLSLHGTQFARILRARTNVADCNWYLGIAERGYMRRPFTDDREANWAFFPGYPLLLRAASRLTGELNLTGVALSTLLFLAALVILHKLTVAFGFTAGDADRAVFYVAAFPTSYFFSLPMTESLFLLLTAASFFAAKRERWLVAGLCGAFASATRSTGLLLLPALAVLYFETYRTFRPRLNILALLLVPAGLLSFMLFLRDATGDALAFKDVQAAWGRAPSLFLTPLFDYLRDPLLLAAPWDFRLLDFLASVGALACGVALVRWRRYSLAAYTILSVLVALSTRMLQSQARYASVLFPAFIALAVWGRSARVDQIARTAFLILLTLMTILFSYQIDIALA